MIKGLSDIRRLHRLARIRLGKKEISKNSGKEYPVALDHFNFADAPELLAIYGDNCKEIEIVLPNERIEAFFPQDNKAYRASGLFCKGDGENADNPGVATRVNVGLSDGIKNSAKVPKGQPLDQQGASYIKEQKLQVQVGQMFEMPCAGKDCPYMVRKFCKSIGRFMFIVPKAPRVGVYEISTTSFNSIVELNSMIETVRGIANRISMIPLKLRLVPKETNVPGTTTKKTIHHLVLEYAGTFEALSQYRNLKEIPHTQLPSRAELEHHIPEDLAPQGGQALEDQVGSVPAPDESDNVEFGAPADQPDADEPLAKVVEPSAPPTTVVQPAAKKPPIWPGAEREAPTAPPVQEVTAPAVKQSVKAPTVKKAPQRQLFK